MVPYRIEKLFGGKVMIMTGGVEFGDCAPTTEQWSNLSRACQLFGAQAVLAPTLAFTNHITSFEAGDYNHVATHIMRSKEKSDGVFLKYRALAGAIPNADCPQVIIYDECYHEMAMLHCGMMCLVRPDGSLSIIEAAIERFKSKPRDLMLWAGFGIGPCCFGKNDNYYHAKFEGFIKETFPESTTRKVQKGPLRGQTAYDLYSMIAIIAKSIGIKHLEIDFRCTACDGRDESQPDKFGRYFSNEYHLNSPLRNCFLAGLA